MKRKIVILFILTILLIFYTYVANITLLPNNIILMQGEKINFKTLWGLNIKEESNSNPNIGEYIHEESLQASNDANENEYNEVGKIDLSLNIFDNLPVKEVSVNVIPKTSVIPLGNAIGLKLYTEGVLIVGKSEINGEKPYENIDIKEGDRIISINDEKIYGTEDLIDTVNESKGKEISIEYVREDKVLETSITPVKTKDEEYKLGLWVRDAAAGVGTATFYIPSLGMFAALGHGITDVDTGDLITISNGELVTANIVLIKKGEKGNPGEIKGSIEGGNKIGNIEKNTKLGVFGKISNQNLMDLNSKEMEVASRNEIKHGKAQIICELESGKKETYEIEIKKIYVNNNKDNKSMLIKVTDERLLEKTGGIIQGMSGSPIIQNDKFVGAVTHVLVNDPTEGYAVFADMMLKQMMQT